MNLFVVGIDPSLTGCSVTLLKRTEYAIDTKTLPDMASPPAKGLHARFERYLGMVRRIRDVISAEGSPDLVLIEGYAYGIRNFDVSVGEFCAVLRLMLTQKHPKVLEVSPSALKKYATGKGIAEKGFVMASVASRWGEVFASNDAADSYVLARLGLAILGAEPIALTAFQKEVIDSINNPKPKKKRKVKRG